MKIGIIGAGKAGTTLGKYLVEHRIAVSGYYSKTTESADIAATFTNSQSFTNLEDLVLASDTIFITTPDGVISTIWQRLCNMDLSGIIVCHFSGSLSSEIFSNIDATGAYGCSIHPMYAFSDKFTSYRKFNTATLTMEGHSLALKPMKKLFDDLGHSILMVNSDKKALYHTAASMASNHLVGLLQYSIDLLIESGFTDEDARMLIGPLVNGNLTTLLERGSEAALTGPIERNDVKTVEKHLQALDGNDAEQTYVALGKKLISISENKNPDKDYTVMKSLF